MPMPQEYQLAAQRFDAFVVDARDALGLATRNQTYTVVEAVLLAFRRRLQPDEVLVFADALPPVLRAVFVAGWDASERRPGFPDRDVLEAEVRSLRAGHNFAPDGAIALIATVLRHHVDRDRFDKAVAKLSPDAQAFWEDGHGAQGSRAGGAQ
ncbi:MAG: DUF2267 domain-containing protein [Roseitalea sp.]|jgi:uncharacterized protein (DUF2267 family)|nr:DUF2267 domain-containing protein [Roseitalea sp.]MBO6722538.1 DUF2267 domain-containing protein [Roseitalea sp.]MBO6742312.1 DUF2267 domain-containing protein [Roseitalea sp.]